MKEQLARALQQLAMMLEQGVPLLQALDTQVRALGPGPLASSLARLAAELRGGDRMSAALQRQPTVFPTLAVQLVRVGEQTGALVAVLHKLSACLLRQLAMRRKTWQALTYPLIILAVTAVLMVALLTVVVPSFAVILQELNTPLPWPTRVVLGASASLRHPLGGLLWLATVAGLLALLRVYLSTPTGWRQTWLGLRALPVVGTMLRFDCLALYCDTLSTMLEAGCDPRTAYKLAAQVSGDPLLEEDAAALVAALTDGENVSDYMRGLPDLYPPGLVQLLGSGEESGLVTRFLAVARENFRLSAEELRHDLLALLEPLLLVGVATLVAGLVLALLLPLQASLAALL